MNSTSVFSHLSFGLSVITKHWHRLNPDWLIYPQNPFRITIMPYQNISATLSDEDKAAIKAAIKTIEEKLSFLANLSVE